ncbi:MAG: phosphodiester glycosidase family protein [Proteobacteria bacterium]|nr:phosphodiester glycosidase family protein [Pseudomonadota bacterium]
MDSKRKVNSLISSLLLFYLLLSKVSVSFAETNPTSKFNWKKIFPGIEISRYYLGPEDAVLKSQVLLVKIDSSSYKFDVIQTTRVYSDNLHATDIKTITKDAAGIIGINANFFDTAGKPLGLIISKSQQIHSIHSRGNVLTGILYFDRLGPNIEHRDIFKNIDVTTALQAGPRLIENRNVIKMNSEETSSRRSGVAINKKKEVILYATVLRFPGASLIEIQHMLIEPELEITQALNLDGGGSSQLFIENSDNNSEIFISGGDPIPVGLIVKKK